jgi:hypothetical protein
VLVSCWSTKGGTGTTVVAATLSLLLARAAGAAVVADLAGDLPLVLGLPPDDGSPGLAAWLSAAPDVPADALGRIEEPAGDGLAVLRRGTGPLPARAAPLLASVLSSEPRPVVVDCGRIGQDDDDGRAVVAAAAERSLLVVRPCFVALRRAVEAPVRATGVVLVAEPGRALGRSDVESALGLPVVARVRMTDAVARAVDAGMLATRLPRTIAEDLRAAA